MKLNNNDNSYSMINCYYQEKKQLRKELYKWSRQITEYCAFESFVEYLLPVDRFKLFNKNYKEHCDKLKDNEMYECNDTIVDEELSLNDCNREMKQQDYDESCFYDENYMMENQLIEEPLDLSNKNNRYNNYEIQTYFNDNNKIDQNNSKNLLLNYQQQQEQQVLQKVPIASTAPITISNTTSTTTRRNYSKEELDKALADIQSGRIGTRRASVLYGIPRSTLRNKVFRLNTQKQQQIIKKQNENELKEKIISNFSLNFAYEKLFGTIDTHNEQQLKIDLINYTKNSSIFLNTSINQYLNNTMFKILNEIVNEKITPNDSNSSRPISTKPLSIVEQAKIKYSSNSISKQQITANNDIKPQSAQFSVLKQKRAKRGQYRKYESDQLTKAVEAVINGLMSVHKAGSHFGVPHSTLEYKVKERNMKHQHQQQQQQQQQQSSQLTKQSKSPTTNRGDRHHSIENENNKNSHYLGSPSISNTNSTNFFSTELLRKLYEAQTGSKN